MITLVSFGMVIVVVVIVAVCLLCYFLRKKLNIDSYQNDESNNGKSDLDNLIKSEEVVKGKDYRDEV